MTTVTVEKGIFIYKGETKKTTETFDLPSFEEENLIVLRDVIEGVLLGTLKVDEGKLDEMAKAYLKRTGRPYEEDGTLNVKEGLLRLTGSETF